MAMSLLAPRWALVAILAFFSLHCAAAFPLNESPLQERQSLALTYCSSVNTASTGKNTSIYQSEGLCHDFCDDDYAFAILQYDGCWCSNYAPADTTSTDNCDTSCPGYPTDICGGDDLYGYIALDLSPSGTQGASSASSTAAPSTSTKASTSTSTSTSTPASSTITSAPTSTKTSTSSATSTWTPTPVVSVETVTGQVRTVTYTPTAPPVATNTSSSGGSSGPSGGKVAGITIGSMAAVAGVMAAAWFLWRKHQNAKNAEYINTSRRESGSTALPGPSRSMSQHSNFMLKTDGKNTFGEWETPTASAPNSRRSGPLDPTRLQSVDPRLDPISVALHHNASRESINTIRDDHDYSRRVAGAAPVLRAMNPDPDYD